MKYLALSLTLLIFIPKMSYSQSGLIEQINLETDGSSFIAQEHIRKIQSRQFVENITTFRFKTIVDKAFLKRKLIQLNIPGGENITSQLSSVEEKPDGRIVWAGVIKGSDYGRVFLVGGKKKDGWAISGLISKDGNLWEIEALNDEKETYALIKTNRDGAYSLDDTPEFSKESASPNLNSSVQESSGSQNSTSLTTSPIRVLTLYTQRALAKYSDIENRISIAFASGNAALASNSLQSTLSYHERETQLFYLNEFDYFGNQYDKYFEAMIDNNINNVQGIRNSFGADIVVLVVADDTNGGLRGKAYKVFANANQAYVVINDDYLNDINTFAHELGHILGGRHENDTGASSAPPYAHAFTTSVTGIPIGSIMVHGQFSGMILPIYSDKNFFGNSYFADVVRVLENRGSVVSNFRADPPLTVSISGPIYISNGQQGTWTANTAGGAGGIPHLTWYTRPVWSSTWTNHGNNSRFFTRTITQPTYMYVRASEQSQQVNSSLHYVASSGGYKVADDVAVGDIGIKLRQNYPNPFNPSTRIEFELASSSPVVLSIFDMNGREISRLFEGVADTGVHNFSWDATGQPNGMYYYRLTTGTTVQTKNMLLLK